MSTPNPDTVETKSKQPTGSSKRKRKHSIKRNIVLEENSDSCDSPKSAKVEKTYGKKSKSEKGKQSKDGLECKLEKNENASGKADGSNEKCLNVKKSNAGHCLTVKPQCQKCKFCSKHIIKGHLNDSKDKQARNKKKFKCEICAKDGTSRVFNSVEKHKHHIATVHETQPEEIKRFQCTDCPETVWFPTKSKFTYHLGTKHPGVMRFVCDVCTETFILKANYKNHMKSHNLVVQKKFSCDVCNGTFVNKAGYEAHKRRFPGPHIKQSCSHCGFSFSREKHMKNHRCKTLLLEAAAKANKTPNAQEPSDLLEAAVTVIKSTNDQEPTNPEVPEPPPKPTTSVTEGRAEAVNVIVSNTTMEATTEADSVTKKPSTEEEAQSNKRVLVHRIVPRRSQDPTQPQDPNVPESVVVQELREIDLENGTFIAASGNEAEQQFIVRDINGHILQLDINEAQQGEENQVYLADWNIVAPYVVREKSP